MYQHIYIKHTRTGSLLIKVIRVSLLRNLHHCCWTGRVGEREEEEDEDFETFVNKHSIAV